MKHIVLAAALFLGACASTGDQASQVQQRIATVDAAYVVATAVLSTYAALPACSATSGALCKDPAVVAQIVKAKAVLDAALAQGKALLAKGDASGFDIAMAALVVFNQALASYGVTAA